MDFNILVDCIVEIISCVWNLIWMECINLWEKDYFINSILCKREFFKNMEIKSCGLIYNQWLDAWAGDHLNSSSAHHHIFRQIVSFSKYVLFCAYKTGIYEHFGGINTW